MTCQDNFITIESVGVKTDTSVGSVLVENSKDSALNVASSTGSLCVDSVRASSVQVDSSKGSVKTGIFIPKVDYCCNSLNFVSGTNPPPFAIKLGPRIINTTFFSGASQNALSFSLWVKFNFWDDTNIIGGNNVNSLFSVDMGIVDFSLNVDDNKKLQFHFTNTSPTPSEQFVLTGNTTVTTGQYYVIQGSMFTDGNGTNRVSLYIDGVQETLTGTIDFDLGLSSSVLFSSIGSSASVRYTEMNLSEFWLQFGQELDFSDNNTYQKFVCDGSPADLGADGSNPTGTQPFYYIKANQYQDGSLFRVEDLGIVNTNWLVRLADGQPTVTESITDTPCSCNAGVTPAP